MPGPYFKGQKQTPCGCYYPDVTRIKDDKDKGTRTVLCINHGEMVIPLALQTVASADVQGIPSDEWRESERERLRKTDE